jgi:NAD+ synthase (glutamine-hydrolysing)
MDYGFFRAAAVSPRLRPADVAYNVREIEGGLEAAAATGARLALFPELCVTGYTCADLFLQDRLLEAAEAALPGLAAKAAALGLAAVVGLPFARDGAVWNCAAILAGGAVAGLVPKSYVPNYKEYYEARWFSAAASHPDRRVVVGGREVPFGPGLLFRAEAETGGSFLFGVEICEDLWLPLPPSSLQALAGALLLLNLSASTEMVGKADYRRELVVQQSARCVSAYLYAAAGCEESTTDVVFSGHSLAAEYGTLLGESPRFSRKAETLAIDFDLGRLEGERRRLSTFGEQASALRSGGFGNRPWTIVQAPVGPWSEDSFARPVDRRPFVPSDPSRRDERCREVFSIQAAGLAKRLEHTGAKRLVIGISGGLDSTLALLVSAKTLDLLGRKRSDILALTMPGFGTSLSTLANARELMARVGAEAREIDIKAACRAHLEDIGHDPEARDITYENAQARERTQILMDLANEQGGIVVGTGDLSEAALGWSTYNGDHMSMYAVNASVPKTLVRHLVAWVAAVEADASTAEVLRRVLETPISPELLPPDENGRISQETEAAVGPYELQDFFLYQHVRWGSSPDKIRFLARRAFGTDYAAPEIDRWLELFYRRFFAQQFKRSCVPDGPKVGSISLSPRGDWRMPSDARPDLWLGAGDCLPSALNGSKF